MTFDTTSEADVRGTYYDTVVKQIAMRKYKFKQACKIDTSGSWTNYFWRENSTALTSPNGNSIQAIPRGADFPQASTSWERVSNIIEQFGLEENIAYMDLMTDQINVKERTLIRIAEGVAKAVDTEIWNSLIESTSKGATPSNIQNINIASGYEWDTIASCAIIDDLLQARQLISEADYETDNLMCFVSPKDYRSIMNYLATKGAQFPTIGAEVANNGRKGMLAGIQIVESVNVTASFALVVVPQRCATWKELVPLSTTTKEDPYKSLTIRTTEVGVTELTDPKAIVLIQNTQAP